MTDYPRRYEPDGFGGVQRVTPHEALFRFAKAVNAREQDKKMGAGVYGLHYHDDRCMRERSDGSAYCEREEQEKEAMNVTDAQNIFNAPNLQGGVQSMQQMCHHGKVASALGGCQGCANEKMAQAQGAQVGQWAPPETLSAKLSRFLFQIQNTQTSLSELQREVEKLRASL